VRGSVCRVQGLSKEGACRSARWHNRLSAKILEPLAGLSQVPVVFVLGIARPKTGHPVQSIGTGATSTGM
jgi:hypothetical protein